MADSPARKLADLLNDTQSAGDTVKTDGSGALSFTTPGMVEIARATASNDATVEFAMDDASYRRFKLVGYDIVTATDDVNPYFRLSNDGGSTFKSGAADYMYALHGYTYNTASNIASTGAAQMAFGRGSAGIDVGNAAGEALNFEIDISGSGQSGLFTLLYADLWYSRGGGEGLMHNAVGRCETAEVNDAIQVLMDSGNITSGTFVLYGEPI